jgi:hypothetical protein
VRRMAAINATKARGTKLDGNRGVRPTVKMRTKSAAARQQRASARAADITPPIAELQADGATSMRQFAATTARGEGARGPRAPGEASAGAAGEIARFRSRF